MQLRGRKCAGKGSLKCLCFSFAKRPARWKGSREGSTIGSAGSFNSRPDRHLSYLHQCLRTLSVSRFPQPERRRRTCLMSSATTLLVYCNALTLQTHPTTATDPQRNASVAHGGPKERGSCGRIWRRGEQAFRCSCQKSGYGAWPRAALSSDRSGRGLNVSSSPCPNP